MSVFIRLWRALLLTSLLLGGAGYAMAQTDQPQANAQPHAHARSGAPCHDAPIASPALHEHAQVARVDAPAAQPHRPDCCNVDACHCAGAHCSSCAAGLRGTTLRAQKQARAGFASARYGSPALPAAIRPPIA